MAEAMTSVAVPEPLRVTNLLRPFNRLLSAIPKETLSVPSMMSVAERRFLFGAAKDYYSGDGIILDAGIFLGASSRCFADGLAQNPVRDASVAKWGHPIVSFERGIVTPTMPAFFQRNHIEVPAQPGESFADAIRANLEPLADLVELRLGDIMETGQIDSPIEILFLDVLKLSEINKFVVENYYPRLIPGKSIVVQQDYFYERLPYIKVYQEFFAEFFTFIGELGSTAIFLCIKEIPTEEALDIEGRTGADEQLRLASIALQRSSDPTRRFLMALSKLRLVRKLHGLNAAQDYLKFVKSEYPEQLEFERYARLREAMRSAEQLCKRKTAVESEAGDE